MTQLKTWLLDRGLNEQFASLAYAAIAAIAVIIVCVAVNFVARRIILAFVQKMIERSEVKWDDAFLRRKVFSRLSHIAPALVIHFTAPLVLVDYPQGISVVETLVFLYMAVVTLAVIGAALNAGLDIYESFEISKRVYLKGLVQVLKLILVVFGIVFAVSQLLGRSPLVFFSGLGAFTAVLLLVFKDAILGLVAGIQLMTNNMVQRGDWIQMDKYGVDGDVIDVSLTTIKVQNWDKTISTIPPYSLVTDSFKNWRGMSESGGRRIKRAVNIDMQSIKFCDAEMLGRFKKIRYIKDYVEAKVREIDEHNRDIEVDETFLINGRHLTNIGTFRAYLEAYLRNHPKIHQQLTFLVRYLAPGAQGLPVEIYVFSNDQVWANYEAIQADIFDHILAVVPLFDLRVYQEPSGGDLARLGHAREEAKT